LHKNDCDMFCNYLHCFIINVVKHALIDEVYVSLNQWNMLS
jgi:hypothetical protein